MAIRNSGSNRLIPTNTRLVDVAKRQIETLLPHQNKRYHNAFEVQGFSCCLYRKLTNGVKCLCHSRSNATVSILDMDGNAAPGIINELLTNNQFGVRPYGAIPTQTFSVENSMPVINANPGRTTVDQGAIEKARYGTPGEQYDDEDEWAPGVGVIVEDGASTGRVLGDPASTLEELTQGFDQFDMGITDRSCPICFGTGYVGGFGVYNGWRSVLDSQTIIPGSATVYIEEFVPTIECTVVNFKAITLPMAVGVDTFTVMNGNKPVPCTMTVDGQQVTEGNLLKFCDGRPHNLGIVFGKLTTFTHWEIQLNQSTKPALFEFPKLSQGSIESAIERTDPFQIVMSPQLPMLQPGDVIVDCTYGKYLEVKSSNWWNDKSRAVLGWECDVRPCQPQELVTLLPLRRQLESQRRPTMVRPTISRTT